MPSLRSLEGLRVYDRKGKVMGTVSRVLCHPNDPIAVGVEIEPPNLAYVVSRPPKYVAFPGLVLGDERLDVAEELKDWSGTRAEKTLGFEWERSVIWIGMPLVTASGEQLGYIADASFALPEGRLLEVLITEGLTSDLAVGTRQIDGSLLVGFDGNVVRVKDTAVQAEFSGGVAAKAGTNVGTAKVVASEAGKTVAALGGKAVQAAAKSKTAQSAWSVLKETGKAFREGMKDEK